jgi:CubicO group peptidase (beta-lactamase class C family)
MIARAALVLAAALPAIAAEPATESARVDALFAAYDKPDSPGCAVGVIRDGRFVLAKGYGMASLEQHAPISPSTVMDPGSLAKQFTAAAVALLSTQGRLSLDDDVRRFVPELPVYSAPIRLRHLLRHTSGLRDYPALFALQGVDPSGPITEAQALAMLSRQRSLNFTPGTEHLYNNSGYFLLALVVKRASGKPFAQFMRESFFVPLGMTRTRVVDDVSVSIPGRSLTYAPADGGGWRIAVSATQTVGDGGVLTTVEDLLAWDANSYTGKVGGTRFLEIVNAPGTLDDGTRIAYGAGQFVREYRGLRIVEHGGDAPGLTAYMARFPDQRLTAMCLCNLPNFGTIDAVHRMADIYLEKAIASRKQVELILRGAPPPLEVGAYAGVYRSRTSEMAWHVSVAGGKLLVDSPSTPQALAPEDGNRFSIAGASVRSTITFDVDASLSRPRSFTLAREGRTPELFDRVDEADPSTAADLAQYAGLYYSDEIEGVLKLRAGEGALRATNLDVTMKPAYRDGFNGSGTRLRFERDGEGRIVAVWAAVGYNRGVRYRRIEAAAP